MSITIAPELRELPHYQLADLLELQGELKDLTERNAAKLRRSITKHGIFVPFFVWPAPDGNTYILDGHQRKRTLVKDGHGALPVPCVLVHADTLPEAKEKLLVISSQYGRITQEGFDEFTFDLPDVGELVHFDALAFEFGNDYAEPPEGEGQDFAEFEPFTDDGFVGFKFGDYSGRVTKVLYDLFVDEYKRLQEETGEPMLDDVLRSWLNV